MNNNKNIRATSNLAMLEIVARKLGPLNNDVVFLGGCTTALFITDPASLDVRTTFDVDCIIDVISLGQYYQFVAKLKIQGFKQSLEDDITCRWHCEDIILDVMPTNEKILGFSDAWFKEAAENAVNYQISDDLIIKSVTPPYFLATKIEAFKTRGNNDFFGSHDFEDIITVINGRIELAGEIAVVNSSLKQYLERSFEYMLKNDQFYLALPGHLNYGPVAGGRAQIVLERIKEIISVAKR